MSAILSECGRYLYLLRRTTKSPFDRKVLFIMLNPSTADAEKDDPTIRRCIGFAERWGYKKLTVANLFAYRATDPKQMMGQQREAIGPDNNYWLLGAASDADLIVCAWGAHGGFLGRADEVRVILDYHGFAYHHLGLTKVGHPKHPLYLKAETRPMMWIER